MASITIRRLDDNVKAQLRIRAAKHGRSMEAEAREILCKKLAEPSVPELNLYDAIRRHVEPSGGFDLEIPPRIIEPFENPFDE